MGLLSAFTAADAYALVLPFTILEEGGVSNDPRDPGNANPNDVPGGGGTMAGVTQGRYDEYRRAKGLELRPVRVLDASEKADLFREYWQDSGAQELAELGRPALACVCFDWGFNGGTAKARWYVQASIGATPDGAWGPATRAALAACDDDRCAARLLVLRACFHRVRGLNDGVARETLLAAGLPAKRKGISPTYSPTARVYMGTWLGRCRRLAELVGAPMHDTYALGQERRPLAA